jgi:transmembrane sensor
MPTWDEFQRELEAVGCETAHVRMPEAASRRVWSRLAKATPVEHERTRPPIARWFAACAAAALTLGAILFAWRVYRGATPSAPHQLAGWAVTEATADLDATVGQDGLVEIQSGGCVLRDDAWGGSLRPQKETRLKREGSAVRILSGQVVIDVSQRPPGAPAAEVLVSGGSIQVLGTRFTVAQKNGSGRVTLHEGKIRFVPADRSALPVMLAPGESLEWPLRLSPAREAPASRTPSASSTAPQPPAAKGTDKGSSTPGGSASGRPIDALLERVAVLRSRGQYRQAAEELAKAQPQRGTPGAESASYELGSIFTYQLADRERGCAHWRRHQRQFGGGTFATEVQRAQAKLGCAGRTAPAKEEGP